MNFRRIFITIAVLLLVPLSVGTFTTQAQGTNWIATYFNNENLEGNPVHIRSETQPGATWRFNAPAPGVSADHWSARWTSTQQLTPGQYQITVAADDGVRVYINGVLVIDEWHGHIPETYAYEFTSSGTTAITIEFFDGTQQAFLNYDLEPSDVVGGNGQWLATYFDNENLEDNPVFRRFETQPGAMWQFNAPAPGVPTDHWSARWTSTQQLAPGQYRISVSADDGVRVYVNGVAAIDEWHGHVPETYDHTFSVTGGQTTIIVEMFDGIDQAWLDFNLQAITRSATRPTASVTARVLNVREEPELNSPAIMQIQQGESYTVRRGSITGWVQLIINGQLGWVNRNFVTLTNTEHLVNLAGTARVRIRSVRLNVRNRPRFQGSEVVTKVNRDEVHPVVGQSADGQWVMIDVNGTFGWVKNGLVELIDAVGLPVVGEVPPQIPPAREYIVVTATPFTVNLRAGPGVDFSDLGNLPRGSDARVIGRTSDNNWWQIEYNGIRAWVAAEYAHIQENADLEAIPISVNS